MPKGMRVQVPPRAIHFDFKSRELGSFRRIGVKRFITQLRTTAAVTRQIFTELKDALGKC